MNEAVNLSFRYLESDYVRALRTHYASRLRVRSDLIAIVVFTALGIYVWRSLGFHWLGLTLVSGAAILALLLVAAFAVIPPLAFRCEPKFRDDYLLSFSQEGIHFSTAHVDSQLEWSIYSRALIDANSYILYYGANQFTVIPKRVFRDTEQRQAFEELLAQHIKEIVRRG